MRREDGVREGGEVCGGDGGGRGGGDHGRKGAPSITPPFQTDRRKLAIFFLALMT